MKCGQNGQNGKIKPPESNIQRAAKTLQMLTNTSIRSGGLNTICWLQINTVEVGGNLNPIQGGPFGRF